MRRPMLFDFRLKWFTANTALRITAHALTPIFETGLSKQGVGNFRVQAKSMPFIVKIG